MLMDSITATNVAIIAIIIGAGSEIIGLLPIRSNTWVQLIISGLKSAFPKKN